MGVFADLLKGARRHATWHAAADAFEADGLDPSTFTLLELPESHGRAAWARQEGLAKAAAVGTPRPGAKYIKRVPTGNAKRPWRYYYAVQHGQGIAHHEHMVAGARFRHGDGHYEVTRQDGEHVTIKHDQTGHEETLSRTQLAAKLQEHHAAAIRAHEARMALPAAVRRQLTPEAMAAKQGELDAAASKVDAASAASAAGKDGAHAPQDERRRGDGPTGDPGIRRTSGGGARAHRSDDARPSGGATRSEGATGQGPAAQDAVAAQGPAPAFAEDSEDGDAKWTPPKSPAIQLHAEFLPDITERLPDDVKRFSRPTATMQALAEHQVEGAERVLSAWADGHGLVLQDSAGLGKTMIALAAIKAKGVDRSLVVVPTGGKANLKAQWRESADLYGLDLRDGADGIPEGPGHYIVGYDELYDSVEVGQTKRGQPIKEARLKPQFQGFGAIAFDESHNMANPASNRARAGVLLQEKADHVLYMSATPYTNIKDMHYLRRLGWFRTGPEFADWAEQAGAKVERGGSGFGDVPATIDNPSSAEPMVVVAATGHVDGLTLKRATSLEGMTSGFKLLDAPQGSGARATFAIANKVAKIATDAGLNGSLVQAHTVNWAKSYWETLKVDAAIEAGKQALAEGKQVAFFTSYKQYKHAQLFGFARSLRRRAANIEERNPIAAQRLEAAAERIDTELAELPPVVNPVHRLVAEFGGSEAVAEVHGDTRKPSRGEQLAYQAGKKKVLVATMDKGGTGLSFHDDQGHAPRVQINLSLPWSGVKFDQVAGRSHRLGSKSPTTMQWIVGDGDTERRNASVVAGRLRSGGALVSGDPDATPSAKELAAFDFGGDQDAEEIDAAVEEAMAVEGDTGSEDAIAEEPKKGQTAEGAAARNHFVEFARARKEGRDVMGEAHTERLNRAAKTADLTTRRAAAQLQTRGVRARRMSDGTYRVEGLSRADAPRIAGLKQSKYGRYMVAQSHEQIVALAQKLDLGGAKVTPLTVEEIGGAVRPRDMSSYRAPKAPAVGTEVEFTDDYGEKRRAHVDSATGPDGHVVVSRPGRWGPTTERVHVEDIRPTGGAPRAAPTPEPAPAARPEPIRVAAQPAGAPAPAHGLTDSHHAAAARRGLRLHDRGDAVIVHGNTFPHKEWLKDHGARPDTHNGKFAWRLPTATIFKGRYVGPFATLIGAIAWPTSLGDSITKAESVRVPTHAPTAPDIVAPTKKRKKHPFVGTAEIAGLTIDIENAKGSYRTGTARDGTTWKTYMAYPYGEIRGSEGQDGDAVDAYLGPDADSPLVVVVHQLNPDTGAADEDKVMLGWRSESDAVKAYKAQYSKPGFYGGHAAMSVARFVRLVKDPERRGTMIKGRHRPTGPFMALLGGLQ